MNDWLIQQGKWRTMWNACFKILEDGTSTSLDAELFAAEQAISAFVSFVMLGEIIDLEDGTNPLPVHCTQHMPFFGQNPIAKTDKLIGLLPIKKTSGVLHAHSLI